VQRLGPFRILEAVGNGNLAFRLELSASMGRIHPVFHASLLEPYQKTSWAERLQEPPPPIEVEGELEYEVREILDSKMERERLFYLVDWVGYGPEERTWEPATNVEHAKDALADFYRTYPQ
jgi:Chromo (CHRromatin Organisation MOdifier) domain